MLHPKKMVPLVQESDSAQESQRLFSQLSPQCHKPQSLLIQLQSTSPSHCQSPRWVGDSEILWVGPLSPLSLADHCLPVASKISADIHSQMLCGCLFLWCSELGSLRWGWDSHSSGRICNLSCCPWEQGQTFLHLNIASANLW